MVAMRVQRFEYCFYFNTKESNYVLRQQDLETNCVETVSVGLKSTLDFIDNLLIEIDEQMTNIQSVEFLTEIKKGYTTLKQSIQKEVLKDE